MPNLLVKAEARHLTNLSRDLMSILRDLISKRHARKGVPHTIRLKKEPGSAGNGRVDINKVDQHFEKIDDLAFSGFEKCRNDLPLVQLLSDSDLQELNEMLDWKCFIVDASGRRFGNAAGANKRRDPQVYPDSRSTFLNEKIGLSGRTAVEVGCFEGVHTASLCHYGASVTAIDSRVGNVVKTMVRTQLLGFTPKVLKADLEQLTESHLNLLRAEVWHHVGVLYHLSDPVKHLLEICPLIEDTLLLDSHYATQEMANKTYRVGDESFAYHHYNEGGYKDFFSGMKDHAKWIKLDDITRLLENNGFTKIEITSDRQERNGPRFTLIARR